MNNYLLCWQTKRIQIPLRQSCSEFLETSLLELRSTSPAATHVRSRSFTTLKKSTLTWQNHITAGMTVHQGHSGYWHHTSQSCWFCVALSSQPPRSKVQKTFQSFCTQNVALPYYTELTLVHSTGSPLVIEAEETEDSKPKDGHRWSLWTKIWRDWLLRGHDIQSSLWFVKQLVTGWLINIPPFFGFEFGRQSLPRPWLLFDWPVMYLENI